MSQFTRPPDSADTYYGMGLVCSPRWLCRAARLKILTKGWFLGHSSAVSRVVAKSSGGDVLILIAQFTLKNCRVHALVSRAP